MGVDAWKACLAYLVCFSGSGFLYHHAIHNKHDVLQGSRVTFYKRAYTKANSHTLMCVEKARPAFHAGRRSIGASYKLSCTECLNTTSTKGC